MSELYELSPAFERLVVAMACSRPRFYGKVGYVLEPDLLHGASSKLALQAAHAIHHDNGAGPDSSLVLLQRLHTWKADGKVTLEQIGEVVDLFDEAEDAGIPDEASVLSELVPVLRTRMRRNAIDAAIDSHKTKGDLSAVVELEQRALRLGEVDTSIGKIVGEASFGEIEYLRTLERLPTHVMELDAGLSGGLQRAGIGVVMAESGGGKCHARGQGILMFDGSVKSVEQVAVGDALMGPDGRRRKVLRTNRGFGEMFDVVPVKGGRWRVNAHHVLTLVRTGSGEVFDMSVQNYLNLTPSRRAQMKLMRVKHPLRVGFRVEPTGRSEDYFGFSLDGDSRYLLDDFTVTHNSMFLSHIAGVSACDGHLVAAVSLELPQAIWHARVISNMTGIPIEALLADLNVKDRALETLRERQGTGMVVVQQMPAMGTTVEDITAWVDNVEQHVGQKVTVLIVDFVDKIAAPKKGKHETSTYETGKIVMEGLRGYAETRNLWCWSASHSTGRTKKNKRLDMGDAAESMHKPRISDLWLCQEVSEDQDEVSWFVAKHRTARARFTIGPVPSEFECGRVAPIGGA